MNDQVYENMFHQGQLVVVSTSLSKHEQTEVGIVSSYVSNSMLGEVVSVQTIDEIFFGKPEFFSSFNPAHFSCVTMTDFTVGNDTNIVLLSALNNIKELPLSKNHLLSILCSANLVSVAAKFPEYERLLPQVSLKNVIRNFISKVISNYDTVAPFFEQFYIENDGEYIYSLLRPSIQFQKCWLRRCNTCFFDV